MKKCSKCKKELSLENFFKRKSEKDGLQLYCKGCMTEYSKQWNAKPENKERKANNLKQWRAQPENKVKMRLTSENFKYKKRYGISTEERNQILEWQNHKCAICGIEQNGQKLHVDHDHKTEKTRMLLCHNCNHLLGHCKDNIQILQTAIEYLKVYQ